MTAEAKPQRAALVPNLIAGLATGLFSIPEGTAYAQLAWVNPVCGLEAERSAWDAADGKIVERVP